MPLPPSGSTVKDATPAITKLKGCGNWACWEGYDNAKLCDFLNKDIEANELHMHATGGNLGTWPMMMVMMMICYPAIV